MYEMGEIPTVTNDYVLLEKLYNTEQSTNDILGLENAFQNYNRSTNKRNVKLGEIKDGDSEWLEKTIRYLITGTTDEKFENLGEGSLEFTLEFTIKGKIVILYVKGTAGLTSGISASQGGVSTTINFYVKAAGGAETDKANVEIGAGYSWNKQLNFNSIDNLEEYLKYQLAQIFITSEEGEREYFKKHKGIPASFEEGNARVWNVYNLGKFKLQNGEEVGYNISGLIADGSEYEKFFYDKEGKIDHKKSLDASKDFKKRETKGRNFNLTLSTEVKDMIGFQVSFVRTSANANKDVNGFDILLNLDLQKGLIDRLSKSFKNLKDNERQNKIIEKLKEIPNSNLFKKLHETLQQLMDKNSFVIDKVKGTGEFVFDNVSNVLTSIANKFVDIDKQLINYFYPNGDAMDTKIYGSTETKMIGAESNSSISLFLKFSKSDHKIFYESFHIFQNDSAEVNIKDIPLYMNPALRLKVTLEAKLAAANSQQKYISFGENSIAQLSAYYNQIRGEKEEANVGSKKEKAFELEQLQRLSGQEVTDWKGNYKEDKESLVSKSPSWDKLMKEHQSTYHSIVNNFATAMLKSKHSKNDQWLMREFPNGFDLTFMERYFGKRPSDFFEKKTEKFIPKGSMIGRTVTLSNEEELYSSFEEKVLYNLYIDKERYGWEFFKYRTK